MHNLRDQVVSALRWTAGARFLGQLMAWVITIYVIRLLSPSDYGLMSMATVLVAFLILMNTIGLDTVLVQKKDLSEFERRQIFGVAVCLNLGIYLALFVTAPLIANFFNEPRLVNLIRVLALQFPMLIFETLPQAQLERHIDFKKRSIVDFITMLTGSLVTFVMAWYGAGVWALVSGVLATTAMRMIGLNWIAPCKCWPSFDFRGMRNNIAFGGFVTLDRGLWFVFAEADKFIGGRVFGKDLLGYYAVAVHLASLPIQKLAGLINAVAFPAFSAANQHTDKTADYLLKANRILGFLAFPSFFGMSCLAPELIDILLGEKWAAAALPMQIIALVMPIRALGNLLPPLLWGIGRPDVSASNFMIAALMMSVAFLIGAQWGAYGMALAWTLVYPLVFLIALSRACRLIELSVSDFLRGLYRPLLASVCMYLVVLLAKSTVIDLPALVQLLVLIALGAVTYALISFLLVRDHMLETMDVLRRS